MKKILALIVGIIITVSTLCAIIGCSVVKYHNKIASTEINTINMEEIKDGECEGFYDVYLLNAKVNVKVENRKVISIKLIEHKHDRYSGEPMIQKVIDNQSLGVDVISGATNSSKTVLKAIEIALSKGKK